MPGKVVDASVIAAVAFQETRALEAEAILEGADLAAPSLLGFELANVARNKVLRDPHRLEIQWEEVDHVAVLELALRTGLATYDASYMYLARSLGLLLVTFDQQLQAAIRGPS